MTERQRRVGLFVLRQKGLGGSSYILLLSKAVLES